MTYWYHPESDSVLELEDGDVDNETATVCVEITKEEYEMRKKQQAMTLEEMTSKYRELEKESRDTSLNIGQREARIDNALGSLQKAMPDLDVSDPRAIPFDDLISGTQAEIDKLSAEVAEEFDVLEEKVRNANAELQRTVEA